MLVLIGIAILTSGFLANTYARIVPLVAAGLVMTCWAYARSGQREASVPRATATDRDVEPAGATAASRETAPRPDRTDPQTFAGTVALVVGICFLIVVAFLVFFGYQLAQSAG
jgi:amino acid transporter